jgi:chemotaxis protein CheD
MKVFLNPGEFYVSTKPEEIATILGSCISVTMFSRKDGVGGICHALLPKKPLEKCNSDTFKYVDSSVMTMFSELCKLGISPGALEVKLFGGADVLPSFEKKTVGKSNIEAALDILADLGLNVCASDVGGNRGRKIIFSTTEGSVRVKKLQEQKWLQ